MKVYALMSTSDPYEPRELEGVYFTLEVATKYYNAYLDKKSEGRPLYRDYLTRDDEQFGPSVFIDEIEVIEE